MSEAMLRYAHMVERVLPIDPAAEAIVDDLMRRSTKARGPGRKLAKRSPKEGA